MDLKFIFGKHKFVPFFWTQFWGAFNDNFFKNALVVIVAFRGVQLLGLEAGSLVAVISGLLILPFFLFSPLAGQISDKYEKSTIIRNMKIIEIVIMLIAALGFFLQNYILLLFVLFLMGLQSTFLGPLKYSMIPELVDDVDLTSGNAFIELGTFLAILLGTILGGFISAHEQADMYIGIGLVVFAIVGYITSRSIVPAPASAPDLKVQYNPFPEIINLYKLIGKKIAVFNSVIAISWFWFFGTGVLSVLPVYVKDYLHGDEILVTTFLAMFTIGIATGSIVCEKLSFKRVEIGMVPIGSIGMSLFLIDIYFIGMPWPGLDSLDLNTLLSNYAGIRLLFDFFMMSIFGGLFIVPLYTLIQERSDDSTRSRVIAANNIVNAFFMVIASIITVILYKFDLDTIQVFAAFSLMNIFVSIYIYLKVPEFTLRFYAWILSNIMYSVTTKNSTVIPKQGAFIVVANHITFVDWLLISGACRRPLRFVMYYKFFDIPVVNIFMRQAGVIPIAGAKENLNIMNLAFETLNKELQNENPICIFPEGRLTPDGKLSGFRPGITKILEQNAVPVYPVIIHNMWGSIFSRKKSKDKPRRRNIVLEFLDPIQPGDASPQHLETVFAEKLKEEPPHKIK